MDEVAKQKSIYGFLDLKFPFSVSMQFLDGSDVVKMTSLNHTIRSKFFSDLPSYSRFQKVFKDKITEQIEEI